MIQHGTLEDALRGEYRADLFEGYAHKSYLMTSAEGARPSPLGYLVKQSPHSRIRTHFHHNAQFQVVVQGSGRIGSHALRPWSVHYAGQQNGYGPLVAGDDGLWYLTLRAVTSRDVWFLPEANPIADRRIPRLQVTSDPLEVWDEERTARLTAAVIEAVIDVQPNGLGAWLLHVPPNCAVPWPWPDRTPSAGRFHVVASGAVLHGAHSLPRLALLWSGADDRPALLAGPHGADVLVTQFPVDAWAFDTMPAGPGVYNKHRPPSEPEPRHADL